MSRSGTGHIHVALPLLGVLVIPYLAGCASPTPSSSERVIALRWQRLVDQRGETCDRCGNTQQEVRLATKTLRRSLAPLGMRVALDEGALSPDEFANAPAESNRIWINDRPLEDWLGGEAGMTECSGCCLVAGEQVQCRSITVDEKTYETIPADLIIRAGLLAAEQSLAKYCAPKPCCPAESKQPCCPDDGVIEVVETDESAQ